ncbi:MAG TPA: hypothetical protein VNU19_09460 [Candidatus Acidoferrum sp.]|jgi:hypothetical protein|nr:hypothetical protein [Candidatus Acidoferrum sp.]
MRTAVLVAVVVAIVGGTAACGAYSFPGSGSGTGNVHGQVVAFSCGGPAVSSVQPCPAIACPLEPPAVPGCGQLPMPGLELVFTDGSTSRPTKTDNSGAYSIDLAAGTWKVSAAAIARIVSGPQTLVVNAGTSTEADYVIDNGMRAAA